MRDLLETVLEQLQKSELDHDKEYNTKIIVCPARSSHSVPDLGITDIMFIRILSIVNRILQIHDAELWQQLRLRRPQSWISYLTYVHLKYSL